MGFPVVGFSPFATLHSPVNTSLRTMTSLQSLLSIFTSSSCAELTMAPESTAPVKSAPVKFACPRLAFVRLASTNVAVKSAPNEIPVRFAPLRFALQRTLGEIFTRAREIFSTVIVPARAFEESRARRRAVSRENQPGDVASLASPRRVLASSRTHPSHEFVAHSDVCGIARTGAGVVASASASAAAIDLGAALSTSIVVVASSALSREAARARKRSSTRRDDDALDARVDGDRGDHRSAARRCVTRDAATSARRERRMKRCVLKQ